MSSVLRAVVTAVVLLAGSTAGLARASARDDVVPPKRPRIGLALGGGGAKGMAHVGVLKVLEELRVPVDYVAGTSMGAIVGGLYASGMAPEDIETLLVSQDWWDLIQDYTPRRDLNFRRKEEDHRYVSGTGVGVRGFRIVLPDGIAAGQKLNNVLQTVTVPAMGAATFDDLNIPYRAVATDLHTGEPVLLDRGNLALAMRASMAVPVVFSPITMDGRTLVDGGVVMNIPVEVVRAMGADIVIAVDVGGVNVGEWQEAGRALDSITSIIEQTYLILQRPEEERQLALADVVIAPPVVDQTVADFHRGAEIIPLGESAARSVGGLADYAVSSEAYASYLARQRQRPSPPITVGSVTVTGNDRVPEPVILANTQTRTGDQLDFDVVQHDVARVHGLGEFQTVTYRLMPGPGADMTLDYRVKEKAWGPGYLRLGLRLQTDLENDAYWNVLLNYTRRCLNRLGGEWRTDFQVGRKAAVISDFYQPLDWGGLFFVNPGVEWSSEKQDIYAEGDKIAVYDLDRVLGKLDAGMAFANLGELRFGYLFGHGRAELAPSYEEMAEGDDTVGAATGRFMWDRLDDAFFPARGYLVRLSGMVSREVLGSESDYELGELTYRHYGSVGPHTFYVQGRAGTSFGSTPPAYQEFQVGGVDFAGLAPGQLRGAYAAVGSLGYRYRLGRLPPGVGKGIFVGIRGDVGNAWSDTSEIDAESLIVGGGAFVGADTLMGPVVLGAGQAEGGRSQFFMSVGTAF